jgi:hypothetical protein
MNRVITNQIEFFNELNREERAQAQTRQAKMLVNQQQEADRREQHKKAVQGAIALFMSK